MNNEGRDEICNDKMKICWKKKDVAKDEEFWALHIWPLATVQCEELRNCERMQSQICRRGLSRTCKNMAK